MSERRSVQRSRSKGKGKAPATASDEPTPVTPQSTGVSPLLYGIDLSEPEHRMRFDKLVKLGVVATRYGDPQILDAMGIRNNVNELLSAAGLAQCLAPRPTYMRFVLEFFSTLEIHVDSTSYPYKIYTLKFQLFNTSRTLRSSDIMRIYGLKRPTVEECAGQRAFQVQQFWEQITAAPGIVTPTGYDPRKNRLTSIRNPVVKYIQKLLSNTLCARKEVSSPRQTEMEILWAIVNRQLREYQEDLIHCFEKVVSGLKAERQKETKSPDPIYCGGLITPIIDFFNIPLPEFQPITTNYLLTWDEMENLRITVQGYRHGSSGSTASYVLQNEGLYLHLPNPDLTYIKNLSSIANLALASAEHQAASVDSSCDEIMKFGRVRKAQSAAARRKRPASSVLTQEERLTAIEDRIGGLEDRVGVLGGIVDEIRADVRDVKTSQSKILALLETFKGCFFSSSH